MTIENWTPDARPAPVIRLNRGLLWEPIIFSSRDGFKGCARLAGPRSWRWSITPLHVPAWVGRLFIGDLGVTMMTELRGASNAKAKRELGWTLRYPSWRQGFRDGVG